MKRRLGVNIDHIATLRQARRIHDPDPLEAMPILEALKVDQVTCHLREDRRHIQDDDVKRLIARKTLPINLEMAATPEMVKIACELKPHTVTLVPERREEITTEGGLDLFSHPDFLQEAVLALTGAGIRVSAFIDPHPRQIEQALVLKIGFIELHTGSYCEASVTREAELKRLRDAAALGKAKGLKVFAGHGLNASNLPSVAQIQQIEEYNIGHSIIGRAVFVGLKEAVLEIQNILAS